MDDTPNTPTRRRRPHPARRARQVTAATSALAAVLLTGALAAGAATEESAAGSVASTTTTTARKATTTTTTTTTTRYSAVAATPSFSATTRSLAGPDTLALLAKLVTLWGDPPKRSNRRDPTEGTVAICVGLKAVAQFVALEPKDPEARSA